MVQGHHRNQLDIGAPRKISAYGMMIGRNSSGEQPQGESPDAEHWGGPIRIAKTARNGAGAKGSGQAVV
jgi:hypothetical protein